LLSPEPFLRYLEQHGTPLQPLGYSGVALDHTAALASLELVRNTPVVVLGGDVMHLRDGRLQYAADSWSAPFQSDTDSFESYQSSCLELAVSYVTTFPASPENPPFFAFTLYFRGGYPVYLPSDQHPFATRQWLPLD
jgi:hypothetical protein